MRWHVAVSLDLRSAELLQSGPERSAGDFDKPAIGLIHFEDQIDRTDRRYVNFNADNGDCADCYAGEHKPGIKSTISKSCRGELS